MLYGWYLILRHKPKTWFVRKYTKSMTLCTPRTLYGMMGRSKKADDEEILRAIATSPDPIVTAAELTERLPYKIDGMRVRLQELEEKGFVRSRDVGARATIWWITPEGRRELN